MLDVERTSGRLGEGLTSMCPPKRHFRPSAGTTRCVGTRALVLVESSHDPFKVTT